MLRRVEALDLREKLDRNPPATLDEALQLMDAVFPRKDS